jgi:hypothetical protein
MISSLTPVSPSVFYHLREIRKTPKKYPNVFYHLQTNATVTTCVFYHLRKKGGRGSYG